MTLLSRNILSHLHYKERPQSHCGNDLGTLFLALYFNFKLQAELKLLPTPAIQSPV